MNVSSSLRYVDLEETNLQGVLIESFFLLPNLERLNLGYNNFTGQIPNSIGNLTQIRELYLYDNHFTGQIPDSIGNLTQIRELDLGYNHFTGQIPNSIGNLTQIRELDLGANHFTGQIPNSIGINITFPSLVSLFLSSCELKAFPHLRNSTALMRLDLSNNKIDGPIPNWFSGMSDSVPHCLGNTVELIVLDLRSNNFSGTLPRLCAQSASYLRTIVLNGNQFEGPVPVSLLNCTDLEVLDLGNNAINDTFKACLGTLEQLQVLILSGSLPVEVFENFRAMINLHGADKGEIVYMSQYLNTSVEYQDSVRLVIKGQDIELEKISTIMTAIDLSSNHFEGVIPKTIKDLGSLWLLNLSHNNFRGYIPTELGQLNTLEVLDLSWNRLIGKIPRELTRVKFLAVLNLSQNLLCGTSDSSHVPPPLESKEEDESYFLSGFTWESVVIGYSCGLVVGTVMWSLMFKARKPKWVVEFLEGAFPKKMRSAQERRLRWRT
ncbi:receptor-like protein 43 [Lycium ferocissimum]|uniref:receptor-like protein 43 n=1 Tax=Lycium ferocissimum TaxID=112874 RepID=UPI002815CDD6|nr:receptor-like protein 43 [Lycium ferocissimum]